MSRFLDLLRLWPRYAAAEEIRTAKIGAIFAVPFNVGGRSNAQIARVVSDLQKELGVPMFTQSDIGEHLEPGQCVCPDTQPGSWVKTHELLEKIKKICSPSWRVVMVGHPHHVWRCALIARRMGFTVYIPQECETVGYDPRGHQWWCGSPWVYIPWEYASRLVLFLAGKI